jgi:hypothetical protein
MINDYKKQRGVFIKVCTLLKYMQVLIEVETTYFPNVNADTQTKITSL